MSDLSSAGLFAVAAATSLASSWLLVSRLGRIGARLGLSEALLGMLTALAADAPEITAAVTALGRHDHSVGTGIAIGSNVFNLAALLGLAGVVAGQIALHRRVILLSGVVAVWISAACLVVVVGVISPAAGLVVVLAALLPYLALLGMGHREASARSASTAWSQLAGGRGSRGGAGARGRNSSASRAREGRRNGGYRRRRRRRCERRDGAHSYEAGRRTTLSPESWSAVSSSPR